MMYKITIASEILKTFTVFAETEEEAQDRAFEAWENWQGRRQRRRSENYGDAEIYLVARLGDYKYEDLK